METNTKVQSQGSSTTQIASETQSTQTCAVTQPIVTNPVQVAPKKSFCGRLFSLKTVGYTALAVSVAAIAVLSKMVYDNCPNQGFNVQSAGVCFDTLRNVTAPIVQSALHAVNLG